MSGKGTGKKSWASLLGEEDETSCDHCGISFPSDQLKPFKSGSFTKNLCPSCHDIEEKKKQDRMDRKKESASQKVVQPVQPIIPPVFQATLDRLVTVVDSLPKKEDINQILSMKSEIMDLLKQKSPTKTEQEKDDELVPTARVVMKELASSKLGYISHYDTFKSRWGMHHNSTIKEILTNLWEDGILLRDEKNRFILDPNASEEKVSGILGDPVGKTKFEEMKKAAEDKKQASSTAFRTKAEFNKKKKK